MNLDDEQKIRNIIRQRVKESKKILGQIPSIYLLIGGVLEKYSGGLSLSKVRYILEELKIYEHDVYDSEKLLKDYGWIIPTEKEKKWLKLSKPAWDYFGMIEKQFEGVDWENITAFVIRKVDEFVMPTTENMPWSIVKMKTKKIGKDLVIYVDKGEEKRVNYSIKAIKNIEHLRYRKAYILHSLKNDDIVDDIKNHIKEISLLPIDTIEGEMWRKEDFRKILEITDSPRKSLDIIMTAMPRACILHLFKELNYPNVRCIQNWYYNKAKKYTYDNSGYISQTEKLNGGAITFKSICFGENLFVRFQDEKFIDIVCDSTMTLIGRACNKNKNSGYEQDEARIDKLTHEMVGNILKKSGRDIRTIGKITPIDVDYNSVWDVINILNYQQPNCIWLSGNRVTALGIGVYWVESLKKDNRINIYAPHVCADKYSEEYVPKLLKVLSVDNHGYSTCGT